MQRFYSPGAGGFFAEDVHGARLIERGAPPSLVPNPDCSIPEDAIPVDDEQWRDLLAATSEGAAIGVVDGAVTTIAPPAAPETGEE